MEQFRKGDVVKRVRFSKEQVIIGSLWIVTRWDEKSGDIQVENTDLRLYDEYFVKMQGLCTPLGRILVKKKNAP